MNNSLLLVSSVLLALSACSSPELSCDPLDDLTPVCGIQMPEDLEPLPNKGGVLISEYGDTGNLPGAISWIKPEEDNRYEKLLDTKTLSTLETNEVWGDADCAVPSKLSPHGIHLSQRGAVQQLLVVNHGDTEQVLFFEVQSSVEGPPAILWRGCVQFPENTVLNDVVALPDGGFAVTHMYDGGHSLFSQLGSILGIIKGHVWRWNPETGARIIPGSSASMPNGIAVADDGRSIWVNNYIEGEVWQYDLSTDQVLAKVPVPNIDNSEWLDSQHLLIASHNSSILRVMTCIGLTEGSCGGGSDLVLLNTETLETEILYSLKEGGPFGPATVAVPYDGDLIAGSFSGDRLAIIKVKHDLLSNN